MFCKAYLAARATEQLVEVGQFKVGYANILDLAGFEELLHLAPSIAEVPVGIMFFEILRIRRGGPVHEVQIDVISAESGKALAQGASNVLVVDIVEFGGEPNLLARHARGLNTSPDLCFVAVGSRRIDVPVAVAKSSFYRGLHLIRARAPGAEADGGYFVTRVESKDTPIRQEDCSEKKRAIVSLVSPSTRQAGEDAGR